MPPEGRRVAALELRSLPLEDLAGKTICQVWNWFFRGPELFALIQQGLEEREATLKFIDYSHFGNIHGPNEPQVLAALPRLLKEYGCDALLAGVGG